jgi:hypothetical protein
LHDLEDDTCFGVDNDLLLHVTDMGAGMNAHDLEKLIEFVLQKTSRHRLWPADCQTLGKR